MLGDRTIHGWKPSPVTLASGALVIAGAFLAATVDMAFLLFFGLGVFGPGALREVGLLRDQDEFQREAARKAGNRAFLVTGAAATVMVATRQWGTQSIDGESMAPAALLLLLAVTWVLSALLTYWGPRRAVSRFLLIFGSFWMVFVILSNITQPMGLLIQSAVAAPFFVLAWTAHRWPQATGGLLLLVAALATVRFDLHEAFTREGESALFVIILLFVPLAAGGVALLRWRRDDED